jgi:hypothetical protein
MNAQVGTHRFGKDHPLDEDPGRLDQGVKVSSKVSDILSNNLDEHFRVSCSIQHRPTPGARTFGVARDNSTTSDHEREVLLSRVYGTRRSTIRQLPDTDKYQVVILPRTWRRSERRLASCLHKSLRHSEIHTKNPPSLDLEAFQNRVRHGPRWASEKRQSYADGLRVGPKASHALVRTKIDSCLLERQR